MSAWLWALTLAPVIVGLCAAGAGRYHGVGDWQLYAVAGLAAAAIAPIVSASTGAFTADSPASEPHEYDCRKEVVILEDGSNACARDSSHTLSVDEIPPMLEPSMEESVVSELTSGEYSPSNPGTYPWFRDDSTRP